MVACAVSRVKKLNRLPWLLVGKGPSLDLRLNFDLERYYTLTLNHACSLVVPSLAHFTDLEAFHACARSLLSSPKAPPVVMPWVPHVNMSPGHFTLSELRDECKDDLISAFLELGKLYAYNSSRVPANRWNPNLKLVRVRYFSAVAGFNLLVGAGHRRVYSLGVDGGKDYATGLETRDRLANGRKSFDVQFDEIGRTCRRTGARMINLLDTLET
jgi:hypothetical protein